MSIDLISSIKIFLSAKMNPQGKSSGKRKGEPKWWWRHIWSITAASWSILIVAQFIMYLLGYIDLWSFIRGILVLLVITPLVYVVWYVRTRILSIETQLKMNRILFIVLGVLSLGFAIFACIGIVLNQLFHTPMKELTFLIVLIPSYIIGGFIGDRLGKRLGYVVPYHLENEELEEASKQKK